MNAVDEYAVFDECGSPAASANECYLVTVAVATLLRSVNSKSVPNVESVIEYFLSSGSMTVSKK